MRAVWFADDRCNSCFRSQVLRQLGCDPRDEDRAAFGAQPRYCRKRFPPGAFLLRRGDRDGMCCVVLRGCVRVVDVPYEPAAARAAARAAGGLYDDDGGGAEMDEEARWAAEVEDKTVCRMDAARRGPQLVAECALLSDAPLSASVPVGIL